MKVTDNGETVVIELTNSAYNYDYKALEHKVISVV